MKRNTSQWLSVLLHCGVRVQVASTWAPIFAQVIGPDTFSKGEDEMPDFLSQILHESDLLEELEEDLYYVTPGRLMKVWPSRFQSLADERPYMRNPEALANKVYGGRMGNVQPGWGWRYHGSGLIQITGADNYRAVQAATGVPVFDQPELLREATPEALRVVIAWWEGNVPDVAMGNVRKVTRAVNGGTTGLEDRIALADKASEVLA